MKNNLYILIFLLLGQNIQYYATHTTTTALTLVCITALASKSSPAPIPAHTDVDEADQNDQKYDRRMNESDDYEEKKSWTCSCKDFINEVGYGNCMREHPTKGLVCYVTRPSSCIDLVQSIGQRGMLMSALACSSSSENKKINGPKNVRSRAGSTNVKFKCGFDDNELSTTPRGRSSVSTNYRYKWKNSTIPYYFYGNVIKGDRQIIQQLMKIMESKSCFRFQEYNSEPNEHHLKIQVGSESCSSGFSGYISASSDRTTIFNSKYQLTDQSDCNVEGGIQHELFHAVGIMHTQKRKDRDSYINVHYDNIENDGLGQYEICTGCVLYEGIPYECSSIMHYGAGTFAKKWPLKTMTALDPSTCTLTWRGPSFTGLKAATDNDWKLVKMLSDVSCPFEFSGQENTWNSCSSTNPCHENQGDCDNDDECAGSLICGTDNCNKLNSLYHKKADCCKVECSGQETDWNCCNSTNPCQENQGDCDDNVDCAGSLICGTDNCNKLNSLAHKSADCCKVECSGQETDWNCCSSTNPCQENQGDCDGNVECAGSLICGTDNCNKLNSLAHKTADCCKVRCSGEDNGCCTDDKPCGRNEGDCDNDSHCLGGLVCGDTNCPWGGTDDCCKG